MRLYGVRLFVDDYAEARAFYADTLGFEVEWEMADQGVAGFRAGSGMLIVEAGDPEGEDGDLIGRFAGVSLQVDDIAATYKSLRSKGVAFDSPPEKQFWGGTLAHFRDPAGNILTLLG